ncbi:Rv3235 family protein [Arthrobacter sp. L77]|uniref:Rv3235 family protein n=1 Tax=Arthrobacter sp. L77 TaxID=1496689 RepID=UPI0006916550|nr:Rv3235 family protein [Arthrobacter sp. L77]
MIPLRSPADRAIGPCPTPGPLPDGDATGGADPDVELRIAGIARSVCQGALEVLDGSRPLQQMARWLDAENYERLQLRTNLVRCIGAHPAGRGGDVRESTHRNVVVRSARVCTVSPGVFEAAVVAFDRKRVRAVALRIEQRRGAWRVTALEIG